MRDSSYSLFTFHGVTPRKRWDVRGLDDLEGDLHSKNVGQVSVVASTLEGARNRAADAGWVRLSLNSTRDLRPEELTGHARRAFLADGSVDDAWLPLLNAFEDASLDYALGGVAQITFLTQAQKFHPSGSPYVCVRVTTQGAGVVLTGHHNRRDYLPSAREALVSRGWETPAHKYKVAFSYPLPAGFTFMEGFRLGLGALGEIGEFSCDDFLLVQGEAFRDESFLESFLESFHPTPKGTLVYHHLPVSQGRLQQLREAMDPYPGHTPPTLVLSAEEHHD